MDRIYSNYLFTSFSTKKRIDLKNLGYERFNCQNSEIVDNNFREFTNSFKKLVSNFFNISDEVNKDLVNVYISNEYSGLIDSDILKYIENGSYSKNRKYITINERDVIKNKVKGYLEKGYKNSEIIELLKIDFTNDINLLNYIEFYKNDISKDADEEKLKLSYLVECKYNFSKVVDFELIREYLFFELKVDINNKPKWIYCKANMVDSIKDSFVSTNCKSEIRNNLLDSISLITSDISQRVMSLKFKDDLIYDSKLEEEIVKIPSLKFDSLEFSNFKDMLMMRVNSDFNSNYCNGSYFSSKIYSDMKLNFVFFSVMNIFTNNILLLLSDVITESNVKKFNSIKVRKKISKYITLINSGINTDNEYYSKVFDFIVDENNKNLKKYVMQHYGWYDKTANAIDANNISKMINVLTIVSGVVAIFSLHTYLAPKGIIYQLVNSISSLTLKFSTNFINWDSFAILLLFLVGVYYWIIKEK